MSLRELDAQFTAHVLGAGADGVGAPLSAYLGAVEGEQVARIRSEVTQALARGSIGGFVLQRSFGETIRALYGESHNASQHAARDFLSSTHAQGVDFLGVGGGVSVLEGFYRFLNERTRDVGVARRCQEEFVVSLLRALALRPVPAYRVDCPLVVRASACWFGYTAAQDLLTGLETAPPREIRVHVAQPGRYLSGQVSPSVLAAMFRAAGTEVAWTSELWERLAPKERWAAEEVAMRLDCRDPIA